MSCNSWNRPVFPIYPLHPCDCCGCQNGCGSSAFCPGGDAPYCPYPGWTQPVSTQINYSCAGEDGGPTLVIHKIVLDICGNPACSAKTFRIRITGPSYPSGEIFPLTAGSCLEVDEPLVISGLTPGNYCIEELLANPCEYDSTLTGPVCGNVVTLCQGCAPVVVTLVNRRRRYRGGGHHGGCGCGGSCGHHGGCGCSGSCGHHGGCGCHCGHSNGCTCGGHHGC